MASFSFRAIRRDGEAIAGHLDFASRSEALAHLRRQGMTPVDLREAAARAPAPARLSGKHRHVSRSLIGELEVLLNAGLPLDRALALAIGNIEDQQAAAVLVGLLKAVREGAPLSRAMQDYPALFTPAEAAMAEAGEANGRLGEALAHLAQMQRNEAELHRLVVTSMIYPCALLAIATGVILLMLLYVVPQFERLLDTSRAQLPAASMAVINASRFLRGYGLMLLLALIAGVLALRQILRRPAMRRRIDRWMLSVPLLGELLRRIDTARFAQVLGTLVVAGVPLPGAMLLARRTIANSAIADAVGKVAEGVREGGGLSAPMAAAQVLPPLAIGFLRTGEETSQLGLMLGRLADVLNRDVRTRLERLVAILTPTITVLLGAVVAGIIASIMSAILGFNDLAVTQS